MTDRENSVLGLCKLADLIHDFLNNSNVDSFDNDDELWSVLRKSEVENGWFTIENQKFALKNWADLLNAFNLENWLKNYQYAKSPKRVGLILAGNIPMVGFHDVISVVLSGHIPVIKLSSKDRLLIPFLLKKWQEFSNHSFEFELVEKLENFQAVIATGSNNTAQYLEFYFKDYPNIIRKNRTSVAVLKGDESDAEIQLLAIDIFRYFGLGCRNVTKVLIPQDFKLDRLFENFKNQQEIINHHKYANNYDYNRAIYLLNQDEFWDNNFVMLKEDERLFPPISVVYFNRYQNWDEVQKLLTENEDDIQCVVAKPELEISDAVNFGEAQCPTLSTYADNVDTMKFLESL